ncbi:hypothetical protein [Bartonella sp. B30(2025)]
MLKLLSVCGKEDSHQSSVALVTLAAKNKEFAVIFIINDKICISERVDGKKQIMLRKQMTGERSFGK